MRGVWLLRGLRQFPSLMSMSLEATIGDPARAASFAEGRSLAVLAGVPAVGMTCLCAAMFADAFFPLWTGYLFGALVGLVLGTALSFLSGFTAYFILAIGVRDLLLTDYLRWHLAGSGPLLVTGVLALVLQVASGTYFRIPWFSSSILAMLGFFWCGFVVVRIVRGKGWGLPSVTVLALLSIVGVPMAMGFLLPAIGSWILEIAHGLGVLQDMRVAM